ncbi:hypothetical protein N752_29860 [Desulforamulus aquiferis]|nr:hypothetical protein N752_29860 [Desulforamulus aquiferis]
MDLSRIRVELVFYISTMQGFSGWYLWSYEDIQLFHKDGWKPILLY